MSDGLSFRDLAASTMSPPQTLRDVLDDEIRRGRVEAVENGRVSYRLTPRGLAELRPLFEGPAGFLAIRGPR